MKDHIDHLTAFVGDWRGKRVLDLGSGRGGFLIEAAKRGITAEGLEPNPEYVAITQERAQDAGVTVTVTRATGESLPYEDASFDFLNINEVIEHVEDPNGLLREAYRVLVPGGKAYLSAPNRFGMRDQHFGLYGVNWLPRAWSDRYISLFGKHKEYGDERAGRQRLAAMHYYTLNSILRVVRDAGFVGEDIRMRRIMTERTGLHRLFLRLIYPLARTAYLDAFHLLLTKPGSAGEDLE